MHFKRFIPAALCALAIPAAVAVTVPTTASASSWSTMEKEMKAGNRVEQAAIRKGYAKYHPTGICDKQGRRYWCDVMGTRGDCFLEGSAWVRPNYHVRFTSLDVHCY